MAEKHAAVSNSTATWQFFLQKLYTFVSGTQSGIVRFASGSGGYVGVKSGGAVQVQDHGDLSAGFGSDNDYIIVEPVNEYPGGDRWQVKFQATDVSDDEVAECKAEVSWLGGFTKANDDAGDPFGSNQTTPSQQWNYAKPTTADTWYFSCANTDTYQNTAGTQTYTYMRVLLYDNSAADDLKFGGSYCGGYIPNEPDNDTKPVVAFFKALRGYNSVHYWGDVDGTATGLAPGNYAHDTGGGNISAFINSVSDNYTGFGSTRSGNWSNGPTLICDNNNNTTLGAFGKYTQMVGDLDRSSGATDSNAEYKIAADQVIRWNPD